jgi:hypothetical protein
MEKKLSYIIISLYLLQTATQAQVTYKDVAPIFIQRCTVCHHQGKIFPYFTSYSATSLYKGLISHDLQTGRMPPWSPDTVYSRFTHERIITQSEKTKIINWIAAGTPSGDTTLAPPVPNYPSTQLNGTPDLVLSVPRYVSNAGVTDKNICFSLPTGLTQNRVLRAYEVVTANDHLVHHIMINVDTLGTAISDLSGSCSGSSTGFILGGYAPGSAPVVFPGVSPVKFGITIKSGSNIIMQVHYPAGTAGMTDTTQIRLFFYPVNTPGIRNMVAMPIKNSSFSIAPDTVISITARYPRTGILPQDISAFAIFPHSHKICTSITNYATNGTGTIPLCRINKWDFERQSCYTFEKLIKIPAGYTLYGKHIFDNTTANPAHSPFTVNSGPGTEDEMALDGLMLAIYQPGDDTIDIRSIIEADSLFRIPANNNASMAANANPIIVTYPNPFTDKLTIGYELSASDQVSLSIYSMMGQKIIDLSKTESTGYHAYEWDGSIQGGGAASPGIYTYRLTIGNTQQCGKIILNPKE